MHDTTKQKHDLLGLMTDMQHLLKSYVQNKNNCVLKCLAKLADQIMQNGRIFIGLGSCYIVVFHNDTNANNSVFCSSICKSNNICGYYAKVTPFYNVR